MPLNLTRSLLTVILPGMVAVGPWLLLATVHFPEMQAWYKTFVVPFHVASFGLAVIAGSAFEEFGNYIEKRWDTALAKGVAPRFDGNWVARDWYWYLSERFSGGEPVGCRYLSRKVTALYFEIGMMCATPIAIAAIALLAAKLTASTTLAYAGGLLSVIAAVVLRTSAKHTHELLCEVRHFMANPPVTVSERHAPAEVVAHEARKFDQDPTQVPHL